MKYLVHTQYSVIFAMCLEQNHRQTQNDGAKVLIINNITMKIIKKINVTETLKALQVGEEMVFPYRQTSSSTVRAAAYAINVRGEAKYKVWQVNHELATHAIRLK